MQILAPLVRGRKGEHHKVLEDVRKNGFVRVRVNGEIKEASEEIKLEKNKKHSIEAVVDRLIIRPGLEKRLADSLGTALQLSGGLVSVECERPGRIAVQRKICLSRLRYKFEGAYPAMFSFNNPYGACPTCGGLGFKLRLIRTGSIRT